MVAPTDRLVDGLSVHDVDVGRANRRGPPVRVRGFMVAAGVSVSGDDVAIAGRACRPTGEKCEHGRTTSATTVRTVLRTVWPGLGACGGLVGGYEFFLAVKLLAAGENVFTSSDRGGGAPDTGVVTRTE